MKRPDVAGQSPLVFMIMRFPLMIGVGMLMGSVIFGRRMLVIMAVVPAGGMGMFMAVLVAVIVGMGVGMLVRMFLFSMPMLMRMGMGMLVVMIMFMVVFTGSHKLHLRFMTH